MFSVEICPDCSARLPAFSPAGLCPRCLLRLGVALAVDLDAGLGNPGANRVHEDLGRENRPRRAADRCSESGRSDRGNPASSSPRYIRGRSPDPALVARDVQLRASSRYQLIGELARGGMGAIFQGRDLDLGRDLAVKVIREEHRDHPEMVRRFVEEAQIGGQLQHPGIVPVHELGRLPDGRLFIAMKLVRGRTLAALLATRRGPDEDRTALPLDLRAGLSNHGLRPCPGRDPPGPEAVEHHGRQLRRGAGHGLGSGQGARPGWGGRRGEGDPRRRRRSRRLDLAQRIGGDGVAPGLGARDSVLHGTRAGTGLRSTRSTSGRMSSPSARSSARS